MKRLLILSVPLLLGCLVTARAAQAQRSYGRPADAECPTGPITSIFVDNHSIFDTSDPDLDARFQWAYRLANRLHFRTDEGVVRRELLFDIGDCYDPDLANESERLLRAMPFLSRVDIYGLRQPDGGYHVVVDTQDEWSTQVGARMTFASGFDLRGADIRESDLFGQGQTARLYYSEGRIAREYGAEFFTPQLGRTRWDLTLGLGRTRAGGALRADLVYPFVGDVGRWSGEQRLERRDDYFDYVRESAGDIHSHVLLPVRRESFDLAAMVRIGSPGNLTLIGAGFSFLDVGYPGGFGAMRIENEGEDGVVAPVDSAAAAPAWNAATPIQDVHALILLGQRNIWWVKRRGLDSPRGVEDVRLGAQAQLGLGRSLGMRREDDLTTSLALYTGLETGPVLSILRLRADARRNLAASGGAPEWDDLFAEAELLSYWKPGGSTHQTLFFRAAGTGGWNTRAPFQLTLGGLQSLRGYDPFRFPGGRRIGATVEDRIYFGWPSPDFLDVGATVFVDAGRIWAGDAPFGVDSGTRASAGFGLRGTFPAGGRTTYRVDLAFPIDRTEWRTPRLLVSVGEVIGLSAPFGDRQILRSRPNGLFSDIFAARR